MDEATVRDIFRGADTLNAARYAGWFTPNGRVVFGNNPPAVGPQAIEAAVAGFFSILDGMRHRLVGLWPMAEGWCVEAEVEYRVKGSATPVPVWGVTVLRTERSAVRDARIYYDLTPVFAAAQAARVQPAPPAPQPEVVHERDGQRGAFVIRRGGAIVAELAYSLAGDIAILEHTEVDGALRGTGTGARLVEASVAWARAEKRRLMPLCPFARSTLSRRPDLQDVVVGQ